MSTSQRLALVAPIAILSILLGLVWATQQAAHGLHYAAALGAGWADLGPIRLYRPWAFVEWYLVLQPRYPRLFDGAGLTGLAVAMAPILLTALATRGSGRAPKAFGRDAWADLADVARAKLFGQGAQIRGRVLGRFKGRYLTYGGPEHAIIVGASRSGKGAGHVVPTLVAWPESAFVYDRKGELWHITADHRKTFSHVFYFAPTDPNTVRWNPLFEVRKGPMEIADIQNVVGTLPETGERFQGAFMPVVARPAFAIRKRPEVVFTLGDYVDGGMMSEAQADTIRAAAEARQNLLIVGGTGSGKTTLANAVLAEPAFAGDRVVLIEDTAELQCSAADQIQMLTKRTEPAVTMTDLVRDTLRLRPDRIVIGEVRDGSALDLLKAWNTGHPGGLATLHANSAAEGLSRLEDLIGEVTQRIPHRAIGQAIDLVIHIARTPGGRRVSELMRVTGWGEDGYIVQAA